MRTLIVEDDFTSRRLLHGILAPYGHCDIAVNGREAIDAFRLAQEEFWPYDLICLDIVMPEMDGHEALREIRRLEREMGVGGAAGVRVIMTTALGDRKNVVEAAKGGIEAYLGKPISKQRLLEEIRRLGLVKQEEAPREY